MPGIDSLQQYVDDCIGALSRVDLCAVQELIEAILTVRSTGGIVFLAGNGGSAATVSHMATDLMFGSELTNPPLRVIALADNQAIITATANDISFERIFSRQLDALGKAGDLLVVVSASGNSQNLVAAVEAAERSGIRTAALTGFDGGQLSGLCEVVVHVPTAVGAYGPVEDAHLAINHMITSYLLEDRGEFTQSSGTPSE